MTRKTNGAGTAQNPFEQFQQTFGAFQSRFEVPAPAREFAQQTVSAAREHLGTAEAGFNDVAASAGKLATAFAGSFSNLSRGVIEAAFANARHAVDTAEKIAAAKTLDEAARLQSDFVRDSVQANLDRARKTADAVQAAGTESAELVQAEFGKFAAQFHKAA